jgi:uncharacterized protein YbcI
MDEVSPIAEEPEDRGVEQEGGPQGPGPADPSSPADRRDPPTSAEVDEEIGREIMRIHEESYGGGARDSSVMITDNWVVVVLDGLELMPNEKFLIENGSRDVVLQVRTQYQQAIQSSFRAAIERATGRTVVGFASTTSVDPPRFMAEVFMLE